MILITLFINYENHLTSDRLAADESWRSILLLLSRKHQYNASTKAPITISAIHII